MSLASSVQGVAALELERAVVDLRDENLALRLEARNLREDTALLTTKERASAKARSALEREVVLNTARQLELQALPAHKTHP